MSDEQSKRLAQLRQAYESGILDEDTYQAALAAVNATPAYQAEAQSGAVSQEPDSTAVGERAVQVGDDVGGDVITGDKVQHIIYLYQTAAGQPLLDEVAFRQALAGHRSLFSGVRDHERDRNTGTTGQNRPGDGGAGGAARRRAG